jgi:carbon monoxide dehydrogenase subunit G/predicted small secreted protein
MQKQLFLVAIVVISLSMLAASCGYRTVRGNGNITTSSRPEGNFSSVKSAGSFNIFFKQGEGNEIKIEADENLMKFIVTEIENGVLKIKTKNGINLRPSSEIRIYVTAPTVKEISIAGSGNIVADERIAVTNQLRLSIAGSGDIVLREVDAPKVEVHIAGSGKATAAGATRDSEIHISGSGDADFRNLKAENSDIHIAGSGNVWVFASLKLDVRVAGGGDVHYYGNPADIKQKIAGSGNLIKE